MSNTDARTLHLVQAAKNGDERAFKLLLTDYDSDLRKIASRYFLSGAEKDKEVVIAECYEGFYKSVKGFNEERGMSFRNFALNLCVKRHLMTAMSAARRNKCAALSRAERLDHPVMIRIDEDNEQNRLEMLQADGPSAIDQMILQDEYTELVTRLMTRLTPLEKRIFSEYSQETSYKDIAEQLSVPQKCVDNALMRIRKKAAEEYTAWLSEQSEFGELPKPPVEKKRSRKRSQ